MGTGVGPVAGGPYSPAPMPSPTPAPASTAAADTLRGRIEDRAAVIGVIGLGYVGLPLLAAFHKAGFPVVGLDLDPRKIDALNRGENYLGHLGPDLVRTMLGDRFAVTSDMGRLGECDVILSCVPTPLGTHLDPDLSYVANTAADEERMVAEASESLGPVDLLVNNAGIASRGMALVDTDPAEIERLLQVHAVGPARLCRLVLPAMRERPRGDIVMISSVATRSWGPNGVPYNMGKGAMEALAFTLAKEERVHGVHVNVVAPGLVETEMGRRLMKALRDVDDLRDLDATMPYGRVCQPEDVARVVAFVCSDDAGYLTGERLYVDGGGQQ